MSLCICHDDNFNDCFLLQAALFGKSFIPEMNPDPCKKTIFTLRVLNAVRDHRVGELGIVLFWLSCCTFIFVTLFLSDLVKS